MPKNGQISHVRPESMRQSTFDEVIDELKSPARNRRSANPAIARIQDAGPHCLNEVWPRIIISDWRVPMNIEALLVMNVRYILNLSHSQLLPEYPGAKFYDGVPTLTYKGLKVTDDESTDLLCHLDMCCSYISEGLSLSRNSVVIVNCEKGVSRSATVVAAYLMKHHGLPANSAIRELRRSRAIKPNDGFVRQLVVYGHRQQAFRDAQVKAKKALDRMKRQREAYWKSFKQ